MYSQNHEDNLFLEYFKDKNDGILLEIGAFDSTVFSNSKALIEKGWSAYLVDASPFCMTKLFEAYKQNDKVRLIQSLITTKPKQSLIPFYEAPFSAVSSTNKEHTKKYFDDKEQFENDHKEILVSSIDLNSLLSQLYLITNGIDFLSIDVEGFSAELAMCLDLNMFKPLCICIEHDFQEKKIFEKFAQFYNFALHNGENIVFTLK